MAKAPGHCVYRTVKMDADVVGPGKAAASIRETTFQEWLSDLVNRAAAAELGRPPVKRRPPPDKPRQGGRPKKN